MRARSGFTLVEMLVAMALTLFVMVILSQAFIAALDTFRGLKAIGDMDEGLRTTVNNLRADLILEHFDQGRRLRDASIASSPPQKGFVLIGQGLPVTGAPNEVDWEGIASCPNATLPGTEYRRTVSHVLHFAGRARGNRPENFFTANVPGSSKLLSAKFNSYPAGQTPFSSGNQVTSQWIEVAYFMLPQGTTDNPNATGGSGTPLYKLYRAQFLVPEDNSSLTGEPLGSPTGAGHENVSWLNPIIGANLRFNTPEELARGVPVSVTGLTGNGTTATVTAANHGLSGVYNVRIAGAATPAYNGIFNIAVTGANTFTFASAGNGPDASGNITATQLPFRRFNPMPFLTNTATAADAVGSTLLLNNVLSFSVQAMRVGDSDFVDMGASTAAANYPAIFDSSGAYSPWARHAPLTTLNWQNNAAGAATSLAASPISGLQISIRVWDPRTQTTRQITIIQDM